MSHQNDDQSVTLVDLVNGTFYELNDSASLVFNNIELTTEDLLSIFNNVFDLPSSFSPAEIEQCRKELLETFFDIK